VSVFIERQICGFALQVIFIQIAVPSRTDVKEYQELKEEMDQVIGRINGRFSTANWSPIRYIYGCVSQVIRTFVF
jgi:trehalose 6-phosphate synthase/phosphatase